MVAGGSRDVEMDLESGMRRQSVGDVLQKTPTRQRD